MDKIKKVYVPVYEGGDWSGCDVLLSKKELDDALDNNNFEDGDHILECNVVARYEVKGGNQFISQIK